MDQGRGLERLARLLLGQPLGGQLAQLVVDQRQELLGRLGVALLDGREDAGDVVHREPPSRASCRGEYSHSTRDSSTCGGDRAVQGRNRGRFVPS